MAKLLALFSGQGAQYPGMGKDLYENFAKAREVYECAGDLFGFDVAKTSFEGTQEELSKADVAQPVTFTLSVAAWEAFKGELPAFSAVAGHSLGEYGALYAAGAYSLEDGMRLLKVRGAAMERAAKACPGAMYAVLGTESSVVESVCSQLEGFVTPVNYNLPTQTVISGEEAAAQKAAELLAAQGAKIVRLSVAGAFHTKMMQSAAKELEQAAAAFAYKPLALDFYSNLTGGRLVVEKYPQYFAQQMVSPVRFVEEVAAMGADEIQCCIEFGPKKTASTFIKKNNKAIGAYSVEDSQTLKKVLEGLGGI